MLLTGGLGVLPTHTQIAALPVVGPWVGSVRLRHLRLLFLLLRLLLLGHSAHLFFSLLLLLPLFLGYALVLLIVFGALVFHLGASAAVVSPMGLLDILGATSALLGLARTPRVLSSLDLAGRYLL